jgi:hypothetical protein
MMIIRNREEAYLALIETHISEVKKEIVRQEIEIAAMETMGEETQISREFLGSR